MFALTESDVHAYTGGVHAVRPMDEPGTVTVVGHPQDPSDPYNPTPGGSGGDGGDGGSGGGGGGGGGSSPGPGTQAQADKSEYSTTPTPCEQKVVNLPGVQDHIQQAIASSNMNAPSYADRSEEGFELYMNPAGDEVFVLGHGVSSPGDPNRDYTAYDPAPADPSYVLSFAFHTHPFAGDNGPSTDPATHFSYYGPPSQGDVDYVNGNNTFGAETDKDGTTFYFGKSPQCG